MPWTMNDVPPRTKDRSLERFRSRNRSARTAYSKQPHPSKNGFNPDHAIPTRSAARRKRSMPCASNWNAAKKSETE